MENCLNSIEFDDIYFQPNHGLEEKKYVFLQGNDLPQNWDNKSEFTIAETGFGVGLNFLNTLKLWHETHEKNQQLHYFSCELFPLDIQQLDDILSPIETLKPFTKIFLDKYPQIKTYGFHRIRFEEFNCTLTLIFGDCVDAFENLDAKIDAWFLDGFAPNKN
ncbi:MAG: tRNA (5-methylaminomethyl-2-thiouridine)(34)-methyltransferase MnmD, partial [Xanthomonadales bacterium]|nr:tRNA (5-methylaminomethyl-2-thiouridine)(34)-methyltransferase MnmD [Xanthomonadales bacterium]